MASADVQNAWTGENGYRLLRKTCNFVRSLSYNYARISGKQLSDASTILDYGCGYGRIARLIYYFASTEQVIGVDPWDRSIAECKAAGLGSNFRLSEYLPDVLPVSDNSFDLAYAFPSSPTCHSARQRVLSKRFAVMRSTMGFFVLTVRPLEYWDLEGIIVHWRRASALNDNM